MWHLWKVRYRQQPLFFCYVHLSARFEAVSPKFPRCSQSNNAATFNKVKHWVRVSRCECVHAFFKVAAGREAPKMHWHILVNDYDRVCVAHSYSGSSLLLYNFSLVPVISITIDRVFRVTRRGMTWASWLSRVNAMPKIVTIKVTSRQAPVGFETRSCKDVLLFFKASKNKQVGWTQAPCFITRRALAFCRDGVAALSRRGNPLPISRVAVACGLFVGRRVPVMSFGI